jgi:hypothetical protein
MKRKGSFTIQGVTTLIMDGKELKPLKYCLPNGEIKLVIRLAINLSVAKACEEVGEIFQSG